jgi:Xaa-Pro aminopeptidase
MNCRKRELKVYTNANCDAFNMDEKGSFHVSFHPLSEFTTDVALFEREVETVLVPDCVPDWLTSHLNFPGCEVITDEDPVRMIKAIKNETEQDGIRACHKRDGKAVAKVIDAIKSAKGLTEKDVADMLLQERQKDKKFRGVSFDTIAGWNENGAKIHGNPSDKEIKGNGLLLIDSGGQYEDGTTDITRTISIGKPTKAMREKFTIVLKAHIALATAIFPEGTTGIQLDTLARKVMWDHGLDYAHGTGHGVGHYLNVHEGPYNISPKSHEKIAAGMLLSNEPGYYEEGAFGIRHENLMLVQPASKREGFLCFETVTKVPFDEDCILRDMLSAVELKWLDDYQKDARRK